MQMTTDATWSYDFILLLYYYHLIMPAVVELVSFFESPMLKETKLEV